MGFRAIEPVRITGLLSAPDTTLVNGWNNVNISTITTIPAPATAVLFYIVNDSGSSEAAGIRHANNTSIIYGASSFAGGRIAHFIATLEGSSGSSFEFNTNSNTAVKFFIGGFFHELTVFEPQNRITNATSTNSWQTKTINEVPTGTTYILNATSVNTTVPNNAWREVGGSVEYPVHGFISFIKLNSNKQFEVNVTSSNLLNIWGYTDKNWVQPVATLTGNTMANTTWSANSNWNDFPITYPNKTGVLVFQDDGWNAGYTGFLRKKGSSWSIARTGNQPPTSLIVEPDSSGVFQYWIASANPTGSLVVSTLFTETVPDYTLTDVNTTEQVSAGDSGIVFTGRGLSTVDKIRIASSNSRYISANVTSASANTVIASIPTDAELFSSNVAFGNVTFSVEVSGNAVANLNGTLSLSSQYGQHVVDSLSSANTNSIYYNQFYPIKVGDKIAYDAITKTHGWSTTVDSNGFISATASYSTQEDTMSYRTYYSDFEQWSTPGTITIQSPYINARANSVRVAKSVDGKRYSRYVNGRTTYDPTIIVTNQSQLDAELNKTAEQLEGQVIGVQYNVTPYTIGTILNNKVIAGSGVIIAAYGEISPIFASTNLSDCSNIVMYRLDFHATSSTGGSALAFSNTTNISVNSCTIRADKYAKASGTPGSPYFAYGIVGDNSDNLVVDGCYIYNVYRCITVSNCSTWTIRGNYLTPQAGSGIQYAGGCASFIVERNHMAGQSWTAYPTDPDAPADPHASMVSIRSNGITIRQNIFRNMGSSSGVMCYTPDAAGGEAAYSNITIENNAIYDVHNNYGIRIYNLGTNFVVRNNLVYSKYRGGADGRYLYETALIVHNLGTATSDQSGLKLHNNLLLGIVTVDKDTVAESNNIAWSLNENSTFYSAWVSGTGSVLQSTYASHSAALTNNTIFANPSDLTSFSETPRDWSLEPSGLADEAGDSSNQPSTSLGSILNNYIQNNGAARSISARDIGPYQS